MQLSGRAHPPAVPSRSSPCSWVWFCVYFSVSVPGSPRSRPGSVFVYFGPSQGRPRAGPLCILCFNCFSLRALRSRHFVYPVSRSRFGSASFPGASRNPLGPSIGCCNRSAQTPFSSCGKSQFLIHITYFTQCSHTSCAALIGRSFSCCLFWSEGDLCAHAKFRLFTFLLYGFSWNRSYRSHRCTYFSTRELVVVLKNLSYQDCFLIGT